MTMGIDVREGGTKGCLPIQYPYNDGRGACWRLLLVEKRMSGSCEMSSKPLGFAVRHAFEN